MQYTKETLARWARALCLPAVERAALRRAQGRPGLVLDRAGFACSELENLCRPLMGLAPVAREETLYLSDGKDTLPLWQWWSEMLAQGLDDDGPLPFERGRASMGDHFFYNQSITEISCMLVFTYLARDAFWDKLPREKRDLLGGRLLTWARRALADSWQNNHLWFPILTLVVLNRLGYRADDYESSITQALKTLDRMYIGDGWYQDGEFGRFDYYVAWSLHLYPLWWCVLEQETFPDYARRKAEYLRRTEAFLPHYLHWFDDQGLNVMFGRSLSYRFAAVSLFPAAAMAGCRFPWGAARRLMFDNIAAHLRLCGLEDGGILPPGVGYDCPAVVESYTSDGGAYWCAKTFLALFLPDDHPFWQDPAEPYPAQKGAFAVRPAHPRVHLLFAGGEDDGVTLYNNTANYLQNGHFQHPFNDMAGYYSKFAYNSRCGFALSCRDLAAYDSMISLQTEDGILQSHRLGFTDLGEQDGVWYSVHTPFSNDPDTVIATALLPVHGSTHVRVHRVHLARPYHICEGGFALPFTEDNFTLQQGEKGLAVVCTPQQQSAQRILSAPACTQHLEMPKPGHHLYAPMSGYPAACTGLLPAGDYLFAAAYAMGPHCQEQLLALEYTVEQDKVCVCVQGKTFLLAPQLSAYQGGKA